MARRASSAAFVGRRAELAVLRDALEAARAGTPGLAVVAGEAGVGKSRLLKESEAIAASTGMLVLRGECAELGGERLPYAPLTAALRGIPDELVETALAPLPPDARAELALVVPAIGHGGPAGAGSASYAQARLQELLAGLVGRLAAATSGLVLVLEDLHWADRPTLEALSLLHRWAREEPMLVIVSYRTDGLRRDHPLRDLLAEFVRDDRVDLLSLEPFGADDVAAQLAGILSESPPPDLLSDVLARAGGNAFFVEELVAAHRTGRAGPAHGLRDSLLLRTEQLGPDAADVLRALAIVGRGAAPDLLAEVSGIPEPRLSRALRQAVDAHVLVRLFGGTELGFRHALMREAIAADLLPGERAALHAAAAQARERAGAPPAELALHWDAAGRPEPALACAIAAGLAAARLYAYPEAREHFDRALRLWETVAPEARVAGLDHPGVLAEAAEAARYDGDYDAAISNAEAALAELGPDGDRLRAARLHERLGQFRYWDDEAALAAYRTAQALLSGAEPAERARLLAAEGHALMGLQRWPEAAECSTRALALAASAAAESEEGLARSVLGVAVAFLGEHAAGEEHLRVALEIAMRSGRAEAIARAHVHLAEVLRLRGRVEEALAVTDAGEAVAREMGMGGSFGRFLHVNGTEDLLALGRWSEAEARLADQVRHGDLGPTGALMHHALAAHLHAARGEARRAGEDLRRARDLAGDGIPAEFLPSLGATAAELALADGRPEEAATDVADALAELGDRADPLNAPVLFALGARAQADLAERARTRGDKDGAAAAERAAATLAAGLDALAARHTATDTPASAAAHQAWVQAELGRLRGSGTAAEWREAVGLFGGHTHAYLRFREGEAEIRTGDREAAGAALRAAHVAATALAARPLADAIEALARRARVALDPVEAPAQEVAPDADPAAGLGLTPRETEVLELLAHGLTNRQIAERLFISVRTAGVHVSRILTKLNATNRVEAAGAAHRLGLFENPPSAG